jgi:autotransporter-associated beta strand protein
LPLITWTGTATGTPTFAGTSGSQTISTAGTTNGYYLTLGTLTYKWDTAASGSAVADGSGTWDAATTMSWNTSGTNNALWGGTGQVANIGVANGAAGTITVNGTVQAAGLNFYAPGSGNYTIAGGSSTPQILFDSTAAIGGTTSASISAVLAGAATSLVFANQGTITLSGTNTFTGPVSINTGTVAVTSASNLGSASSVHVASSGTLSITQMGTFANPTLTGNGTLNLTPAASSPAAFSGSITGFSGTVNLNAVSYDTEKTSTCTGTNNTFASGATININSNGTWYVPSNCTLIGNTININSNGNSEGLGALRIELGGTGKLHKTGATRLQKWDPPVCMIGSQWIA